MRCASCCCLVVIALGPAIDARSAESAKPNADGRLIWNRVRFVPAKGFERDMLGGTNSVRSLYCQRRRLMSDGQLAQLGLDSPDLDFGPDWLPRDAAPDIDDDEADPVRLIGQLEFRLYQGNMLLRDADANGSPLSPDSPAPGHRRRLCCRPAPARSGGAPGFAVRSIAACRS